MAAQHPVNLTPKEKRIREIIMERNLALTQEEQRIKEENIKRFGAEMIKAEDRAMAEIQYAREEKERAAQPKAAPIPAAPAAKAATAKPPAPNRTPPKPTDGAKSVKLTQKDLDEKYDKEDLQIIVDLPPVRPQPRPAGAFQRPAVLEDPSVALARQLQAQEDAKAREIEKKHEEENERAAREMQAEEDRRHAAARKQNPRQAEEDARIAAEEQAKEDAREKARRAAMEKKNEEAARRLQNEQHNPNPVLFDLDAQIAAEQQAEEEAIAEARRQEIREDDDASVALAIFWEKEEKRMAAERAKQRAELQRAIERNEAAARLNRERQAAQQHGGDDLADLRRMAPNRPAPHRPAVPAVPVQQRPAAGNPGAGAVPAALLNQFNQLRLNDPDLRDLAAYIGLHEEKENAEMLKLGQKIPVLLGTEQPALEKMQGDLAEILKSPSVNEAWVDAHKYTRSHISKEYPQILAIDKALKLSDNPAFADTEKSMRAFLAKTNAAHKEIERFNEGYFNREIGIIKGAPGVDGETGIHVTEMISRAWSLATLLDYYYKMGRDLQVFEAGQVIDKNNNKDALDGGYRATILQSLSDNIRDAGQCIPGVIARLHPIYLTMMSVFVVDTLEHKLTGEQPIPKNIRAFK